jgi:hypothetical protein
MNKGIITRIVPEHPEVTIVAVSEAEEAFFKQFRKCEVSIEDVIWYPRRS